MADDLQPLFELALEGEEDAQTRDEILTLKANASAIEVPQELLNDSPNSANENNLNVLIKSMSMAQKLKLAMYGNQAARQILIRDPLRKISLFVLSNPRISDAEIVDIAGNTNLDQQVFREVNKNGTWMKNYAVKRALVFNPKVPIDISSKWLKFLQDKDLEKLSKSKNIPQVVSSQSKKLLDRRKE